MASTASSSFSLLRRSSSFCTSSHSLRCLGFAGAAFSVNELSKFRFLQFSYANPINVNQNTNNYTRIPAAVLPSGKHLINNGSKVRKKIEDMTYQLIDAKSRARQIQLSSRSFCSHPPNLVNERQGPAAMDYRSVLQEDQFHKLADSTIHDLLEKIEEYGDSIDIDGFDIDYGNEVLTLKLGDLGTYVVNKQTPNRQIWLSSPVSGPSRYDWDPEIQAWIYRRNQVNLFKVLESEIEKLCGKPINLS